MMARLFAESRVSAPYNMEKSKVKKQKRDRRHGRVRARLFGTPERPRLAVFRSNRYISAQIIDDINGKTLADGNSKRDGSAEETGKAIAKKAIALGIKNVVFDRGGFLYMGNVKALADGARAQGLEF